MKHILLTTFMASVFLTACASTNKMVKTKITPAVQLEQKLVKLQKKGYMIGHQDDPMYGTSWKYEYNRSDTKEVCGDYPALMGFDLGMIELGSDENLDGVPFDRMREEIQNQYNRGGVITLSWHPYNPVTGENAWDPSGDAVTAILPGGAQHAKFEGWLNTVAQFILSLKTKDGQQIPIIFRPWHEMSGGWFWWGIKSCTTEQYKQLYRMTIEYMRSKGITSALYGFSPNFEANDTEQHYLKYYPGDEYVDLMGIDIYQFDPTGEEYMENLDNELKIVTKLGKEHHKIICLAETGYQNVPDSTWFTTKLMPVADKYPISYLLLWRNAWDKPKENFGPAPGKSCVADFLKFYKAKKTLFIKDIKDIK